MQATERFNVGLLNLKSTHAPTRLLCGQQSAESLANIGQTKPTDHGPADPTTSTINQDEHFRPL
jgi:hypothetical protein